MKKFAILFSLMFACGVFAASMEDSCSGHVPGVMETPWIERTYQVKIGDVDRTAYLVANTVIDLGTRCVPGFYWMNLGGNQFLSFEDATFDEVLQDGEKWNSEVVPKLLAAMEAGRQVGLEMPPADMAGRLFGQPANWHPHEIRSGDTFAFGTFGSPSKALAGDSYTVEHPGHGPTDDFSVVLNLVFARKGHKAYAIKLTLIWGDNERDVLISKSCYNGPLFGHIRKVKRKEVPPDVPSQKTTPPNEAPEASGGGDRIPPSKPRQEYDVRNRGVSWGVHTFASASTGAKVNNNGDLVTDKMELVQGVLAADMYYVKPTSADPLSDDSYLRSYLALGGRHLTNRSEASDEVAGAGTGVTAILQQEYVNLIGDSNTDLIVRGTANWTDNSNSTSIGLQAAVEARPREGRGFGGSISYSDTCAKVPAGTDVDGKIIDARIMYQVLEDGGHTPLPDKGHLTPYIGYDVQEYTSSMWTSKQSGPKLGVQWLHALPKWKTGGEGIARQVSPFFFLEAYAQNTHVKALGEAGYVFVEDDALQVHVFGGFRIEF